MPNKPRDRDGVFQRNDRSGWYVSYVDVNGTRKKQKIEAYTRTQALTQLAAIKTKVQKERVLGVKHASEISTTELMARFKRHQKTHLRPTTFARLDGILEILKANLPERLKEIKRKDVAAFVSARSEAVAPATVHKEIATLKHALRLAVEWDLIHENPALGVRLPNIPEGRTRYLSPTELKATLEKSPEWMRAPIALAAFTGMRRGELLSLKWMDVDLANRRVYLRETKNGTLRILALNDLAAMVIESLPKGEPSGQVLAGVDGQKLSVYTRRVFEDLGIQDASFHSLRHTAASWLVMQGVDLYAVGQLLGHKTPRMTQRYAHLSPQYMANAVGKLDAVFAAALPRPKE